MYTKKRSCAGAITIKDYDYRKLLAIYLDMGTFALRILFFLAFGLVFD